MKFTTAAMKFDNINIVNYLQELFKNFPVPGITATPVHKCKIEDS